MTIRAQSSPGEVRVAVFEGEEALAFALWRPGRPDGVGDVYRARVTAVVPGLAGSFLALPEGDGFLPDSHGAAGRREGETLTVRVVRAAQGGKGARLSGRMAPSEGPPGLVARGPSPLEIALARYPGAALEVDDAAVAIGLPVRAVVTTVDLDELVARLTDPAVALPGGLWATIEPTRALVAIDVDMAGATAGRQAKAAAQFAANRAVLPALVREIVLRNVSGAILIDLAGLSIKRRAGLGPDLVAALAMDPLEPRLLGFTALGMAEIVRARVHPPLHELVAGPHAAGLDALRVIARESRAVPYARFGLVAAPEVVAALDRDPVALTDLARRTGRALIPKPEPALSPGRWRIERGA